MKIMYMLKVLFIMLVAHFVSQANDDIFKFFVVLVILWMAWGLSEIASLIDEKKMKKEKEQ